MDKTIWVVYREDSAVGTLIESAHYTEAEAMEVVKNTSSSSFYIQEVQLSGVDK
jgi:hypothetical protein